MLIEEDILNGDDLDVLILQPVCIETLNAALTVKTRKNTECKLKISLKPIYTTKHENLDLICDTLTKSIHLMENVDEELKEFIVYINNGEIEEEIRLLRLLNEVLIICKSQEFVLRLLQIQLNVKKINNFLLHSLKVNTFVKSYILYVFLPNYLFILNSDQQVEFLDKIFEICKEIHDLNIFCTIYTTLNHDMKNYLFRKQDYWNFLENSLQISNNFIQSQAIFLFSQSVYYILENNIPFCLNCTEKLVWIDFFTLLDASREKQLHLIEPVLNLLKSIEKIDFKWKFCLYKALLNHKQNFAVYKTAIYILSTKFHEDEHTFQQTLKILLSAINKNEYYLLSNEVFNELNKFTKKLNDEQFNILVGEVVLIVWKPTSFWKLSQSIFHERRIISNNVFLSIFLQSQILPHIYIRKWCNNLLIQRYFEGLQNLNGFKPILLKLEENLSESDFKNVVFTNLTKFNIVEFISEEIKLSLNSDIKETTVYLKLLSILNEHIIINDLISNQIISNEVLILVYTLFFHLFDENSICNAVKDVILTANQYSIENVINLTNFITNNELFLISKQILLQSERYCDETKIVALNILKNTSEIDSKVILDDFKWINCSGLLLNSFLDCYCRKNPNSLKLIEILVSIFEKESDQIVANSFKYVQFIIKHGNDQENVNNFVKICINELVKLKKSSYFKAGLKNFIENVYQPLVISSNEHLLNEIHATLTELSDNHYFVSYYWIKQLNNTFLNEIPMLDLKFFNNFIPVIVNLMLEVRIIKKEEKIDYFICQEILETFNDSIDCPNCIKTSTHLNCLEIFLYYSKNSQSDEIIDCLLEKYNEHFNKRYFPDSQIHIEKLRIAQCLNLLQPFLKNKNKLMHFIEQSFYEEIHQPCVKQLFQLLLIRLLNEIDYSSTIKRIIDGIKIGKQAKPSTICNFIPVLYHTVKCGPENDLNYFIEAILPLTMGANFKLRVFSQFVTVKLCKLTKRFNHLEKCLNDVIKASENEFYNILKTDLQFIIDLDPNLHYSIETIYYDIPKQNNVMEMEWKNVFKCDFKIYKTILLRNYDRSYSNHSLKTVLVETEPICDDIENVQRKITPWKMENSESKSNFILVASLVEKHANLGGLSRTCEVFGVKDLVVNNSKIKTSKEFTSLTMSSENWVNMIEIKVDQLSEYLIKMKSDGYTIIGAEQTANSVKLNEFQFPEKTILLLGNEKCGIRPDIIPILDVCVEIPQLGLTRSLNVHVAGATFIWEYVKQWNFSLN